MWGWLGRLFALTALLSIGGVALGLASEAADPAKETETSVAWLSVIGLLRAGVIDDGSGPSPHELLALGTGALLPFASGPPPCGWWRTGGAGARPCARRCTCSGSRRHWGSQGHCS